MERHQNLVQVVPDDSPCADIALALPPLSQIDPNWPGTVHLAAQIPGSPNVIVCKFFTCAIWDLSLGTYVMLEEQMLAEHDYSDMVALDKHTMFVAGGRVQAASTGTAVVESLDIRTMTWTRLAVCNLSHHRPIHFHSTFSLL